MSLTEYEGKRNQNPISGKLALKIFLENKNCKKSFDGFEWYFIKLLMHNLNIHWSNQLKDQHVLLLSSFVHNSSFNEHKNMKLRENTSKEMVNWNLY